MAAGKEGGLSLAAKVDLMWKVVVIGGLGLAGRLSWQAWQHAHETQERLVEIVNLHETRLAVIEKVLETLGGG